MFQKVEKLATQGGGFCSFDEICREYYFCGGNIPDGFYLGSKVPESWGIQSVEIEEYVFRNLPCSILPDEKLWCVSGKFGDGGGILEWCYDEEDANFILSEIQKDSRFSNLKVSKYLE